MARVLVTNFHPHGGGGHVPYILALLGSPGHTFAVATPKTSRVYQYLEESCFPALYSCDFPAKVQKELPSIIKAICNFKKIIDDFKPDIVHVNGGADLFIAVWAYPGKRPYRLVRTHHAIKSVSDDIYHRWLYRQVAYNIYVSHSAMKLSTSAGMKLKDSIVIENGIDLNKYSPRPEDPEVASKFLNRECMVVFGSCAGTGHYKRVDLIIKAAKQLLDEGIDNFIILVLGENSSGKKLAELAQATGVNNFHFCGFSRNPEKYISVFDVGFVLSDSIETISFAAREMMAMGKPLISSSFSGLKENVVQGVNGLLTEPGNVAEVASAMKKFLEMSPDERRSYSVSARSFAEEKFDINIQQNLHSDVYEQVLAKK